MVKQRCAAEPGYQILTIKETVTSVQVEECSAINQGDSDDQEEEEVESGKLKIILKNKLFQVYITCFYHVITSVCFLCLHKCVDLLLKLCKIIRQVHNKCSMHHYFNICCLPFTNHFLNQLKYLMMIFLCTFDYLNNLINLTPSIPICLDN